MGPFTQILEPIMAHLTKSCPVLLDRKPTLWPSCRRSLNRTWTSRQWRLASKEETVGQEQTTAEDHSQHHQEPGTLLALTLADSFQHQSSLSNQTLFPFAASSQAQRKRMSRRARPRRRDWETAWLKGRSEICQSIFRWRKSSSKSWTKRVRLHGFYWLIDWFDSVVVYLRPNEELDSIPDQWFLAVPTCVWDSAFIS